VEYDLRRIVTIGTAAYELLEATATFADAQIQATKSTLEGSTGELLSIGTAAELAMLKQQFMGTVTNAWMGAAAVANGWMWSAGDRTGLQFWQGGVSGSAVGSMFAAWASGQPSIGSDCAVVGSRTGWRWSANACNGTAQVIIRCIALARRLRMLFIFFVLSRPCAHVRYKCVKCSAGDFHCHHAALYPCS